MWSTPRGAVRRVRAAMAERRVTMRPAPDCMAQVTAFLPAAQGMAVYSALSAAADSVRAGGGDDQAVVRSWPTPWSSASPDEAGFRRPR